MSQDQEHLRLLSIFHYVVAGIAALFSMFPIFHLVIGIGVVTGKLDQPSKDPTGRFIGWALVLFAVLWILAGLTFAVCLAVAGRCLARRSHYTYCLVMAALNCMFMPFGTVLGVFTIIVLLRDSVKQLFGKESVPQA
jgi:hypothetical protein